MLAYILLSIHNITELIRFTERIRDSIQRDCFATEFQAWL
jgi:queuine tRNA-ribosyltransferase